MTNQTYTTEEQAEIIEVVDPTSAAAPTTLSEAIAQIEALKAELLDTNIQLGNLETEYDVEVKSHAETAQKRNEAEKFALHIYRIWADELGLTLEDLNGEGEAELRAFIGEAIRRAAMGEKFERRHTSGNPLIPAAAAAKRAGE